MTLTQNQNSGISIRDRLIELANEYSKAIGINYGSLTIEFQKGEAQYTALNIREKA